MQKNKSFKYITCFFLFFCCFTVTIWSQKDCDDGPSSGGHGGPNQPPDCLCGINCSCVPIQHSFDPNDITGATGYESPQWISVNDQLGYTIRFENSPEFATAPAQIVRINCPLDSSLALTSLRLGDFGFGAYHFQVPRNKSFYSSRLDVRDSLGIYVDFTAGIDVIKKEVFWIFESIDPATGLAPDDAFAGFLPVNDTTVTIYTDTITQQGEGFVSFSILPKATALTGDSTIEQADIIFDVNAPITTNIWKNVIDAFPPSSQMTTLPPETAQDFVWLNWTAMDDLGGVGISHYNLYVSKNDGPFYLYETNIDTTAFRFQGEVGTKVAFYTTATDWVGNQEKEKTAGDTYTTFQSEGVLTIISPSNANYCATDTLNISWILAENPAVDIDISLNGDNVFSNIVQNYVAESANFSWPIPETINCTNCTIRIKETGGALEGISNSFVINPIPMLTFSDLQERYCTKDTVINLNASPSGGIFMGNGITGNNFNPSTAGVGTQEITYTFTNNEGCSAEISKAIELVSIPEAQFSFSADSLTYQFAPMTTAASTNWFWDFGDNTTAAIPNPTHIFEPGTYTVCLTVQNSCGTNNFCQTITTSSSASFFNIGGFIAKEDETPISGVSVAISDSTVVTESGNYGSQLFGQQSYVIHPTYDANPANGLSVFDLLLIQKHILGKTLFDSPYKIIGADMNGNQRVTVSDIITAVQLVLGKITAFPNEIPAWRFVPKSYVFPNPENPFEPPYPETIQIENLSSEMQNLDFVAIKVGDMNLSATINFNRLAEDRETGIVHLTAPNQVVPANTEILLPFQFADFNNLLAFQLGLDFDENKLALIGATPINPKGFYFHQESGNIKVIWMDEEKIAARTVIEDTNKKQPVFFIRFKTKTTVQLNEVIRLNTHFKTEAITTNLNSNKIELVFEEKANSQPVFEVYPNPTNGKLFVKTPNPVTSINGTLFLFDNSGHEILNMPLSGNKTTLDLKFLPNGLYHLQLNTTNGSHSKRFIKN